MEKGEFVEEVEALRRLSEELDGSVAVRKLVEHVVEKVDG